MNLLISHRKYLGVRGVDLIVCTHGLDRFGLKNQLFNLVLEWLLLQTKRHKHTMMSLSDKAIEELKEVLLTEIGEEKVTLLSYDDLKEVGCFLLVLRAEAIKRRMKSISTQDIYIPNPADLGHLV